MKDSKKAILTLRMCSKDFARLTKGEITREQREVKPFWESRLLENNGSFKQFDEIHIKNGYKTDSPLAVYEFWGIQKIEDDDKNPYFRISFGSLKTIDH